MLDIGLFVLLSVILFGMRRVIHMRIQGLAMLMGGGRRSGVILYSLVFLPGIMIHELAHFLVATFLGVQTGEIDLIPRTTGEDGRVALGSVKVAKTDFVRSSLIGAAPFFVGCSALYALLTIFFSPLFTALNMSNFPGVVPVLVTLTANWQTWLAILLMFIVGNTMFTSKEDAGAFPVLGVMVLITLIGVYVFGQYGWLNTPFAILVRVARALHASFAFVIVLNLMVASLLKLIEIILQRVTGKRVVYGGK